MSCSINEVIKRLDDSYPTEEVLGQLEAQIDGTRARVAHLIGADQEDVYLASNTTMAMKAALEAMPFHKGDEIITTTDEYASIRRVIDELQDRHGVVIKTIDANDCIKGIHRAITGKTRLVGVSYVTHKTCNVLPVKEIAEVAHRAGAYLAVDAAQAIGHIKVNVSELGADVVVGCGHKWLRSELTSGILYSNLGAGEIKQMDLSSPWGMPASHRSKSLSEGQLDYDGWGNIRGLVHLGGALEQFDALGWESIFRRIVYLGEAVRLELKEIPGVNVQQSTAPGMIPFCVNGMAATDVTNRLETYGIIATQKTEKIIRVSVSPFNTTSDIAKLADALYLIGKNEN